MIDQRVIPDVTEPYPGYTNAQLRERVRKLRGMNRELLAALISLMGYAEDGAAEAGMDRCPELVKAEDLIAKAKELDA